MMNKMMSTFHRKLGEAVTIAFFIASEILQRVWNKLVDIICLLYVALASFQNWLYKRTLKIEDEAVKDWWMVLCERGRTSPETLMAAFLIMVIAFFFNSSNLVFYGSMGTCSSFAMFSSKFEIIIFIANSLRM
jgi:hypothetical protein